MGKFRHPGAPKPRNGFGWNMEYITMWGMTTHANPHGAATTWVISANTWLVTCMRRFLSIPFFLCMAAYGNGHAIIFCCCRFYHLSFFIFFLAYSQRSEIGCLLELSWNDVFNPISSHFQWFSPIPILTPRFSLVFIPIHISFPLIIPIPTHSYSRTTTATTMYNLPHRA